MNKVPTPPIHPHSSWATSPNATRYPQLLDVVTIVDLDGVVANRAVTCIPAPGDPHSHIAVYDLGGLRLSAGGRIPYSCDSSARGCWRWPDDQLSSPPPPPARPARLPDVYDSVLVIGLCGRSAVALVTIPPSPADPSLRLQVYRGTASLRFPAADGGAIPYSATGGPGTWRWPD